MSFVSNSFIREALCSLVSTKWYSCFVSSIVLKASNVASSFASSEEVMVISILCGAASWCVKQAWLKRVGGFLFFLLVHYSQFLSQNTRWCMVLNSNSPNSSESTFSSASSLRNAFSSNSTGTSRMIVASFFRQQCLVSKVFKVLFLFSF